MDLWGITAVGYLVSLLGVAGGGPGCTELAGLDLQRSLAWESGSPSDVESLYVTAASAEPDVAALRQWTGRGLEVESAMLVIGSCTADTRTPDLVRLTVVDRLAPTRAVDGSGVATSLPVDTWSGRHVVLQQVDGRWRYAEVTPE
ncbi:hypothetical protein [Aeromicrobium sp. Sec7.5]|uniref:hypothetical protein n=1 Tax=Aeromicrobium sp. Sec7.5 TaxID=3121276 RepID=UPI002FE4AD49